MTDAEGAGDEGVEVLQVPGGIIGESIKEGVFNARVQGFMYINVFNAFTLLNEHFITHITSCKTHNHRDIALRRARQLPG